MKKQLTAEQIEKRDARKAKFKALWAQVADMPAAERDRLAAVHGIVTVEGRSLSGGNQMLLLLQIPGVSVVGGFRQWLKAGRCVAKGQHGAMIWCPAGARKSAGEPAAPGPVVEVVSDGETSAGGGDTRFIIGTVFDISQTVALEVTAAMDAGQIEALQEVAA